jgi:hypothetical protein
MRSSQWLLGLATTSAIVAAVASGCGGSSTSGGSNDSGAVDVSTADHVEAAAQEAAPETGPMDAAPEVAACVPVDADLTTYPVPDASVGGVNLEACVGCLRSMCSSQLQACNADCVCIDTIFACIASGAVSLSCVPASAQTDPAIQGIGLCALTSCGTPCGPPKADGGGSDAADTGTTPTDAGDGG